MKLFKLVLISCVLSVGSFAFAEEQMICGTIQATTSISGGEQMVMLTAPEGTFIVVSGPTESLKVEKRLRALKRSLQAQSVCVKTAWRIIDSTILASGFTKFQSSAF